MRDSAKPVRVSLNGDAASQFGESGDPIVGWTTSGTARWMIDASGCLVIAPLEGEVSGELDKWDQYDGAPWRDSSSSITSAKIEGQIAVSTAEYMFFFCSSLETLDLSGLDTSRVTYMRDMFRGCSSLTSLDLSGLDTSCAEDMSDMFSGCPGLRTVTLGEKFTFVNPYSLPTPQGENLTGKWLSSADGKAYAPEAVPNYVAATYTAQTKADISGAYVEFGESDDPIVGWTTSGTARWMIDASGCLVIAPLEGEESGELGKWDCYNGAPWSNYAYLIISAKIEGAIVVSTARDMFSGCSLLTSLDLSGLDTSRVTGMYRMFYGCSSLESLDLSSLDASSAEDMSCMFYGCSSLSSLDLSGLDTSRVTGMYRMFYGCSSLESLDLSSLDASSAEDMSDMFYGCSSLESLDLSGLGTSKVTNVFRMFLGCSSLESLDLSGLGTSSVTGMSDMFSGCSSLESLDLSGLDTSSVEYMSGMFEDCFALRAVTLGAAFSFEGIDSHLPTPQGENLTGKWLSSADGKAYAPEAVPNNVAATYTAQTKADISGAVISDAPGKVTAAGSQLALKPVVTFNGERLVEGEDYTVSYGDSIEPGVGARSVTVSAVEGKNFTGSVTVFFDIETKITFPDVDYDND